jgi:hypothetical protein
MRVRIARAAAKLALSGVLAIGLLGGWLGSAPPRALCGTGAPPYGIKCPTVIDEAGLAKYVYQDWYTVSHSVYEPLPGGFYYKKTTTTEVWGKYKLLVLVCSPYSNSCNWGWVNTWKNHYCGKNVSVTYGP